jgi:tetratricopeptide (TPR) repeat protein
MLETASLAFALTFGLVHAVPGSSAHTAANLPLTKLSPAKLIPNLCLVKYRVSTASPECQAFFDQGLGYYYSYVWMEAARSFETAARHDPDCAMAWWGLSQALERWGKGDQNQALQKARDALPRASHREQLLIRARLQEKGMATSTENDKRPGKRRKRVPDNDAGKQAAIQTIDELLSLYDDDEEGWFYRAQLAGGTAHGGNVSSVPFCKALLRINPLHPGANHELVHFYETQQRPALGWIYAENYIKSSPGIPHAYHMQAHLATRLGRWDKTSDRSARAIELERAYHKEMNVRPKDDDQYSHHLQILTLSLIHDGRFREAHAIKQEAERSHIEHWQPWFRLALAERDWPEALRIVDHSRKSDKETASYLAALVYLKHGNVARAASEVEVLRQLHAEHKDSKILQDRVWETEGLLLCRTGAIDPGLSLLAKVVERSKNDYGHHAWGNGSYYMEAWGQAALETHRKDVAEEAFLEALAHDPGSVRAALGLQVLCERQGRTEEARRYAELARRCWRKADPHCLAAELASMRGEEVSKRNARIEQGQVNR